MAATITLLSIAFVIIYILLKGVPHLTADLFAWKYNSDNVSLLPALVNTVYMAVISLAIAVPIGIGSAIYLVEYAGRGNKFVEVIKEESKINNGIHNKKIHQQSFNIKSIIAVRLIPR